MANTPARIPTHLVLGFLGAGKTTAILNLMKQKPAGECWAVLVNEFGEVGIDGAMLSNQGVAVKEVPGGCMCCVSGLPMQIGLNSLISFARPDRLFIEPTGLGHPAQVIETLTGEFYRDVLHLSTSVCLVDPRRLEDERVLASRQFHDQVAVAELLVASKADLCTPEQLARFDVWASDWQPAKRRIEQISGGQLPLEWLAGDSDQLPPQFPEAHHHHHNKTLEEKPSLAEEPWQSYFNKGDGYTSMGWRIHKNTVFDPIALQSLASNEDFERFKGVVHTTDGWWMLNAVQGTLTLLETEPAEESRLEIISRTLQPDDLDHQLRAACFIS
ncbi:GTP-binding protein [Marinobacter sp. MDS2]|uniref:CobW family GTP-binding protein n=1 Tax=Marinobacter sp. MDS2 TaxID=3065961 RepID=UPI00273C3FAE|nr:GTP-binding protein [Marinobacter sp. MDS2]MDP4547837.1 GTP-binding protein [Marinobacter sp. MDS2]